MSETAENCTHDCGSCTANCGSRTQEKTDFLEPLYRESKVKKVIGIVSGKGGVGKSSVTSLMAITMARKGYKVGILDADITGPSIPKMFGIKEKAYADEIGMYPVKSKGGIDVMSVNLLLENDTDPVLWRGPILGNVVKQFYTDVIWKDIDYLFVDMPPGTGDVALTVFQSLPIDGIVIVSTPQDLVKMIVNKAYNMANMMNIPVLGLIENMSYYVCPNCNEKINIFGKSKIDETAAELGVPVLAKLPINPEINLLVDEGRISEIEANELDDFVELLK